VRAIKEFSAARKLAKQSMNLGGNQLAKQSRSLGVKMWPSDQESLGSKQLAERSGSLGWKYWSSKHEVLAGSTGHASKEAQRTDAGNSIITDEQRMLRVVPSPGSTTKTRRIGDQGGGRIWCDRCSSAGKKGCLPDVGALGDPSNQAMTLR
jgi:hypothetical protein